MKRLLIATVVLSVALTGTAQAFPTWHQYRQNHKALTRLDKPGAIHPWENEQARLLWQYLLHKSLQHRYELFIEARKAYLASLHTSSPTYTHTISAEYTGDHLALLLCIHGYEGAWDANTGNGFWGGLQFYPSTWFGWGGGPFDGVGPFPYSSGYQLNIAEGAGDANGWTTTWLHSQWPVSSRLCGA